jgi:hypothetical protein
VYRLATECGLDPTRVGDLTYPAVIALLSKGDPDHDHNELWAIKKTLADHASGRLAWRDDPSAAVEIKSDGSFKTGR